jgi:LmbE family N-acetylglucosaminyl deacetylase
LTHWHPFSARSGQEPSSAGGLPQVLSRLKHPLGQMRANAVRDALRQLPIRNPHDVLGDAPILVLAPHPDDESLGCGGTIADCRRRGQDVRLVVLTDGSGSHPHSRDYPPRRLAELRKQETHAAAAELGIAEDCIAFLDLPDGSAPLRGAALRSAAGWVANYARTHRVGIICTTWLHDPHPDHLAAYRTARLAAAELGAGLLCFPVWGWNAPARAWRLGRSIRGSRVDVGRWLAAKRRAIACHCSQVSDLIKDDPTGFRLTPEFLAYFDQPYEVLLNP